MHCENNIQQQETSHHMHVDIGRSRYPRLVERAWRQRTAEGIIQDARQRKCEPEVYWPVPQMSRLK